MSELYLGTILTKPMGRDALHVAIVDVIASELLHPGEFINFVPGSTTEVKSDDEGIGIIDPYLRSTVKRGDRVWMFLLPNTVTSLRHVWTHPAFPAPFGPPDNSKEKEASQEWIENYASGLGLTFEELMLGADSYLKDGDYLCRGSNLEGEYTSDEFWDHYEVLKGFKVTKRDSFFSCSC